MKKFLLVTYHDLPVTAFNSPTDEMNYLDAVAFIKGCVRPVNAAHDAAVKLNRQSLRRKLKMLDKLRETKRGGHIQHFAIYFYTQNN